ncbi:MBL fold metallo-hydrolase [Streptomyces sp. NPDC006134]|uniref:MBL fold metallo-hydrolase n=1 Tax=Streptomyces sp. NPDC006134 TaxID=3154467 RepID=UPI0033FD375F
MSTPTPRLTRRGLPAGGAAAIAPAVAPQAGAAPLAAAAETGGRSRSRTVVHLLGTAGGPPPYGGRMGIASAVTVGTDTYLVDCGRGAVTQYLKAGLSMPSLKGVFLTHLHADHIVGYFVFPLLCAGVMPPQPGFGGTVRVWGPGPGDTTWFERQGMPAGLVEHMRHVHTGIGGIAATARARRVVLSHLAPADPARLPDAEWAAARASARKAGYRGRVTVGHDLMRIPLG